TYRDEVVFQKTETETVRLKGIYRQPVLHIMKIEALFLYHTFGCSLDLYSGIFSLIKDV
ncbi:hypothetical protein ABVT39_019834, partial [Epinephelus coioides]